MKRMIVMLMAMVCVAGFANAQTVTLNSSDTAITFDIGNTDWFATGEANDLNVTSVGLSLYKLNNVGVFDYFMRVNTQFGGTMGDMFQPENDYGFTYGATARVSDTIYVYGGLGVISDFGHKEPLLGTASYGALYRGKGFVLGFGDDTNAGATISVGNSF